MEQEYHLTFGPFRVDTMQGRVWHGGFCDCYAAGAREGANKWSGNGLEMVRFSSRRVEANDVHYVT
jgi:hypothetical protein